MLPCRAETAFSRLEESRIEPTGAMHLNGVARGVRFRRDQAAPGMLVTWNFDWRVRLERMGKQKTTIRHSIQGNPVGPTLVFIHGWPDDDTLWRMQVSALGDDYRCFLLTLPNFGDDHEKIGGFDFPELVERLAATIREVHPGGPVGLVIHDWGAHLGYLLEQKYPELVDRMAALDIGAHMYPLPLKARLIIVGYQWALVLSWWAGGVLPPLGNLLTRGVANVVGVPERQRAAIRSRYNYLYFYLWRATLLPRHRYKMLTRYKPRCPLMFLYGKRKPLMFHSPRWLEIVAASGGWSEGVEGAGHWLMESHAETVNASLARWFSAAE